MSVAIVTETSCCGERQERKCKFPGRRNQITSVNKKRKLLKDYADDNVIFLYYRKVKLILTFWMFLLYELNKNTKIIAEKKYI